LQPGSSIMPGKVNPVLCESLMQVCARVMGHDSAITFAGASGGNFQLNIMMPMMGQTTLESIALLGGAAAVFARDCVAGLQANEEACRAGVEKSLSMVTSLNPLIGYARAAELAKEAFKSGKTIRELCQEKDILPNQVLQDALDPFNMTEPRP
jgi:fumarate hydratase class II